MSSVDMRKLKINTCAFVVKISEHDTFKKYMLDYIKDQPTTRLIENNDDITNTDWKNSKDNDREYVKKFCKILKPYLLNLAKELQCSTYQIGNMWYQQYAIQSRHQWHYHNYCNWSAVYFLELPNNDCVTQMYDIPENQIVFDKEIVEGDLYLFPSNILHRSPPNNANKTKSIISFNVDFDDVIPLYHKGWTQPYYQ